MTTKVEVPSDLLGDVVRGWERLTEAKSLLDQSSAFESLNDDMFQLATWHPGFNSETGEVADD